MKELAISQIGVQKATDPELKKFSQRMIDDHTKMNQKLMTLAAQKGIALPRALDPCAQFCAQSLAGLSGDDFDKCYVSGQLAAHITAVGLFEAEAERGQDPDVKAFAAKILPTLKEHKHHVMAMHKEMEAKMKEKSAH